MRLSLLCPLSVLLLGVGADLRAETAPANSDRAQIEATAKTLGVAPADVRPSPVPGLYEVTLAGKSGYVTPDGRYFVRGDMFELATRTNLTEQSRKDARRVALAALDESQLIVFSPTQPKHTITVFTDVDCGYCRKLHSEIATLNDMGIRVRYVAFPRDGRNTETWTKMESVWCAKDPREALTRAKRGEPVAHECARSVDIGGQYQVGARLGIDGTPRVYADDGRMLGGYLSPQALVARLEEPNNKTAARQ